MACERLELALKTVKSPVTLLQYFAQEKESLDFSSRLIHRWPTDDHCACRLEWASKYVVEKVAALLSQDAWNQVLARLIAEPNGGASGIMFEAYVLRAFREGGHTFEIRDLETGDLDSLDIPREPKIQHFSTITQVAHTLHSEDSQLCLCRSAARPQRPVPNHGIQEPRHQRTAALKAYRQPQASKLDSSS